ncbi:hypothetical protein WJX72_004844 [[Myrmecia] bisecta]|uniref:Uncharacterized protein n=1 Tax=[Myrmecia] bisecta TaxID=41462 RepID=A0AAW1PS93_9CHLO
MDIGPTARVQGISGWLHSPTEQSEADLVDRISVDVLNKLNPRARELPGIRVGVEAAVRDLVASAHLQQDQQVRVLGLAEEGVALLKHRLGGRKVLLVLDDVAQQSGPDSPDMRKQPSEPGLGLVAIQTWGCSPSSADKEQMRLLKKAGGALPNLEGLQATASASLRSGGYRAMCAMACVAAWLQKSGSSLEGHDGCSLHKALCAKAFEACRMLMGFGRQRVGRVGATQHGAACSAFSAACAPVAVTTHASSCCASPVLQQRPVPSGSPQPAGGLATGAGKYLQDVRAATRAALLCKNANYRAKLVTGSVAALLGKHGGGSTWLQSLHIVQYSEALEALCTLMGIGPKVAALTQLHTNHQVSFTPKKGPQHP